MVKTDTYVMLICSLPSPEALFAAKQPPLSRLKLDQRLRMLSDEDAATLNLVEDAVDWRRLPITVTDRDVIERGRQALSRIESATLRQIVLERLELRTCVAALRRRARGEGPPSPQTPWGFGRWIRRMTRNWNEPGFRLEGAFPWIPQAERAVRKGQADALERLLLDRSYKSLQRHEGFHAFDLEAVVIYVLKWNIVDRATRYNAQAAARRFDGLTQAGLGAFAALDWGGEDDPRQS